MANKTSANAKAAYARYENENRADSNSKLKLERHMSRHPGDAQSANRVKPRTAGMSHVKTTQFMASLKRSLKTGAFGNLATA